MDRSELLDIERRTRAAVSSGAGSREILVHDVPRLFEEIELLRDELAGGWNPRNPTSADTTLSSSNGLVTFTYSPSRD